MKSVRLNEAQREAVEHAAGPLIVLAGPGTGKTRVIVHRIEHAVSRRGVEPGAVLGVTFTVKAANQLRERLAERMGPAAAAETHLHTFNGLGMRLLTRFGDMLGLPPLLTMIDAAQASRLVRRIVLERNLFRASRGEGLPTLARQLLAAFEAMANLGKTPAECREFATAWEDRLARGPGAGTPEEHEAAAARCARFRDEAEAYEHYTRTRWSKGWMTYSDQLLLPIRLLREHAGPRAILRADYRTLLVDEFQDCNPAQIELLRLLAGPEGRSAPPDVCVVGDDDQSIYGFRHADDRAFQRFRAHWPGVRVVALTENYRSGRRIITVANAIIARAGSRFAPDKTIEPPRAGETPEGAVQGVRLTDDHENAEAVAAMLVRDRAASGREWSKYAVIVRTALDADRVCDALRLEHVPFDRRQDKTVLDEDGVADVMAWIDWLLNPRATWSARRVLARPPFGVAVDRLVALEQRYTAQRSRAAAGAGAERDPGDYAPWLRARAGDDPGVARALELHGALHAEVAGVRGDEAVWRIIRAVDPAHAELLPAASRARRAASLIALLALVRDKQPRLEEPGDLRALVAHLDELRSLRALRPTGDLGDADADAVDSEGDEAEGRVQVLTAHSAKGLEFDTVFVPRVSPPAGYPKAARDDDDAWEAPEGLAERLDDRSEAQRRMDEERRVFYVACTRAERRLVLLAKWNKTPSKAAAHFFEELLRTPTSPLPIDVLDAQDVLGAGAADAVRRAAAGLAPRETAGELAQRTRTQARLDAAGALEAAQSPGADPATLARARRTLDGAAATLAAVAGLERHGALPAWFTDPEPPLRELADRFRAAASAQARRGAIASLIRPMAPPLSLSYSTLHDWEECPRCFYLKHCMNLPEPVSTETNVGTVLHDVLHRFFDRWRTAEAEGRPAPGEPELVETGRAAYLAMLRPGEPADDERLDQLRAQLHTAFARLHDPRANIIELEKQVRFPYELDGASHSFEAKIDRIDQLADGSFRIVDYKTGKAWGFLTSPRKDDLQMGIYVMALRHLMGGPVRGVAEYWCLSTGERGSIGFDALDDRKVRAQIDRAARAMLAGDFPRKSGCGGACVLLGD